MKKFVSAAGGAVYKYRADGMRTEKESNVTLEYVEDEETASGMYDWNYAVNKPTTRFYYDGQMPVEEDYAEIIPNEDPFYEVTRYGLGARGVDMIERETLEDTIASYPIYDGHGNMLCTLTKSGSSYAASNWRYYDVWGGVNSGSSTGVPANRYCANLGHVEDDESGLVYMRARYYEPWTGRFVSEDPARQGSNWHIYCGNDPVGRVDFTGRMWHIVAGLVVGFIIGALGAHSSGGNVLAGGLGGMVAVSSGMFFGNALAAGFVSGFVGSLMADITGKGLNGDSLKKALVAALAGAAIGGIVARLARAVFGYQVDQAGMFVGDDVLTGTSQLKQSYEGVIGAGGGVFAGGATEVFWS